MHTPAKCKWCFVLGARLKCAVEIYEIEWLLSSLNMQLHINITLESCYPCFTILKFKKKILSPSFDKSLVGFSRYSWPKKYNMKFDGQKFWEEVFWGRGAPVENCSQSQVSYSMCG